MSLNIIFFVLCVNRTLLCVYYMLYTFKSLYWANWQLCVKGKWQYIFLFSRLKEHLKPYLKLFYRFFISCLLLQIF